MKTVFEDYLEKNLDVSTPEKLAEFMSYSKSKADWNARCELVKKVCGDYPSYWYQTCIASGLIDRVLGNGSSEIKMEIVTFPQEKVRRGKLLQQMVGDWDED